MPRPRPRVVVVGAAVVALLAGLFLAVPVAWLELDGPPAPPVSAIADLPEGAQVTAIDRACGSGGCWLEVSVLAAAGTTGQELSNEVTPDGEVCGVRSVVDLRRVCTSSSAVGPTDARFVVRYDRYLDL